MKAPKPLLCIALLLCISFFSQAQVLKGVGNRIKQKSEQRANQKIDQAIDKGLDKTEETATKDKSQTKEKNSREENSKKPGTDKSNETLPGENPSEFKTYSKFDFVPGDKIVAIEDFSQVAAGDFPDKWNTNSTGEIQNIEGRKGNWLSINKPGIFLPEFITALPENFTFEFELYCSKDYSFYSSPFSVVFTALNNPAKDFVMWKQYSSNQRSGVLCWFHPQDASMNSGHTGYEIWSNGKDEIKNEGNTSQFISRKNNFVKVSVWRQKNRLRVYMNEEKVWDVPRAFSPDLKYNSILFVRGNSRNPDDRFIFSNLRLAVGSPDTRNRLITEGKFVTRGILFDVNSDKIKGESYGVLKEIATVLKENEGVKVKIIGHTDSDGDDKTNVDLSKRRAEAVRLMLTNEFGIDGSRMVTDGKGASQPVDKNTSAEGKANNRRVEFNKL